MSVVTIPALVAPIFGPVVGGLIIGHASWRWIFYVNVPVCLLAVALAWRVLPADEPSRGRRLDLIGLLLLSPHSPACSTGSASSAPAAREPASRSWRRSVPGPRFWPCSYSGRCELRMR